LPTDIGNIEREASELPIVRTRGSMVKKNILSQNKKYRIKAASSRNGRLVAKKINSV
jgi:hypothetical protein